MSFANAQEAITALSNVNATQADITAFVRQLSVEASGSVTVLYSGDIADTPAWKIVKEMGDARRIDNTMAAKVLDSDAFKAKVAATFGEIPDAAEFDKLPDTHPAKLWLGKGGAGPWAVVSEMFLDATTGPVKILTESPLDDSVFIKNELPKLIARLESGAITEVAGATRATLLELAAGGNLADDILRAAKVETIVGKPAIGSAEAFLGLSEMTLGDRMKQLAPSDLGRVFQVLQDHPFGGVIKRLPLLGQGLAVLGALATAAQAGQAYADGKPDEALHLIEDMAAEFAGSMAGVYAGGVLATLGLTLVGVATVTPVGMSAILIATVAGGFFGGDWGKELIYLFQDRTEEKARDTAQRMLKLIFGADYGLDTPLPQGLLTGGTLQLDSTFSREEMVAAAQTDIAWRYALRELNPFVISGADLYAKHNADGTLDLYDPATGTGTMTELYLQDRAAMLTWKLRYDRDSKLYTAQYNTTEIDGNWDFVDQASGVTLAIDGNGVSVSDHQIAFGTQNADNISGSGDSDHLYGMAGNDALAGGDGADYLEGGLGNDTLTGGTGADQLYGGAGDDTLHGDDGAGGDLLEGGKGYDTYYADEGDTIRDEDGRGIVYLNGKQLGFALRKDGNTYYLDGGGNSYQLVNGKLEVGDPLGIEGFDNGELGIYLDEEEDPGDPNDPNKGGNLPTPLPYNPRNSRFRLDPLGLDLNGDGMVGTVASTASRAYLDYNGDGIAEKTGWIAPEDGLLALDGNGNGVIDGLGELFGTAELDGFSELAGQDKNLDGAIDAQDAVWDKLKVWRDANGDGVSQAGELQGLDSLGIVSIGLATTPGRTPDGDNIVGATGEYLWRGADGTLSYRPIADLEFAVNFALTDGNPVRPLGQTPELDGEVFGLPWLRGYGIVKSLHLAYQEDTELRRMAAALAGQGTADILQNFEGLLAQWTGLNAAHAAMGVSRSEITMEDKVWMLEVLTGQNVDRIAIEAAKFDAVRMTNGNRWNVAYIESNYRGFIEQSALAFMLQAKAAEWLPGAYYSINLDRFVATDLGRLQAGLETRLGAIGNEEDARVALAAVARLVGDGVALDLARLKSVVPPVAAPYFAWETALAGTRSDDGLQGSGGAQLLLGGMGGDYLSGNGNNDLLMGETGNDVLVGGGGDDLLDGGSGDDHLDGGAGSDTYLFERGDGQDTIRSNDVTAHKRDVLKLGAGLTPADIEVSRTADNLMLVIRGGNDKLTIEDYFKQDGQSPSSLEAIEFADGTNWDFAAVRALLPAIGTTGNDKILGYATGDEIDGLAGDDNIEGRDGDDRLIGNAGIDRLYGQDGNDTLEGGAGNDFLDGGSGDDVYLFGRGAGQDTISCVDGNMQRQDVVLFREGITEDDVYVGRYYNDLILGIAETQDRLTIKNYFLNGDGFNPYGIDSIRFSNGASWNYAAIKANASSGSERDDWIVGTEIGESIDGLNGNDYLQGGDGNDTLVGGAGHDRLSGESGDDILDGGAGADVLSGGIGNDRYRFGIGYGQDSVDDNDAAVGNVDVVEMLAGVAPENVTVSRAGDNLILGVLGTTDQLTIQNYFRNEGGINAFGVEEIRFEDNTVWDYATVKAKSLEATENDDYLVDRATDGELDGKGGNDTLYGRGGNDKLLGQAGNDQLFGEEGDDLLDGGSGVDSLQGGNGNDRYRFGRGYGQDTIIDGDATVGNIDVVEILSGVLPGDVSVVRYGNDLILKIMGTADQLTIRNYFDENGAYAWRVEEFRFDDNTVWDFATITTKSLEATENNDWMEGGSADEELDGKGGDDTLKGRGGNDTLLGGAGSDQLYGDVGADVLDGGQGGDRLEGGTGNDRYRFGLGSGQDTIYENDTAVGNFDVIEMQEGVSPGDVRMTRDGSHLYLMLNGGADKLTLQNWLTSDAYKVEQVKFADGTVWDAAEMLRQASLATEDRDWIEGGSADDVLDGKGENDTIYGRGGNDSLLGGAGGDQLFGEAGNDTLDGGGGSDNLQGGAGNDRYRFGAGYGQDMIYDQDTMAGNIDTVEMQSEVSSDEVKVSRTGYNFDDLCLSLNNGADRLTLSGWFSSDAHKVERVVFADGTEWDVVELSRRASLATEGDDVVVGTAEGETLEGLGGRDQIYGRAGDDNLLGGGGDDRLYGEAGEDTLDGGGGSDNLQGDAGNDRYRFGAGYGQDTIFDYDTAAGNIDTVEMQSGVNPEEVKVSRNAYNNDLYLSLNNGVDRLTLSGWFSSDAHKVEKVVFADGTEWEVAELSRRASLATEGDDVVVGTAEGETLEGLGGDDQVYGRVGDDNMLGGGGDDQLYGEAGDDTLDGGEGIDNLQGGAGNDRYRFGAGYGQDTIVDQDTMAGNIDTVEMLAGVTPDEVKVSRNAYNNDLYLSLNNGVDRLTLSGWFSSDARKVEKVVFADGTEWDVAELLRRAFLATEGDDVVVGTAEGETLEGLGGRDQIYSRAGDDRLLGGGGDDRLYGV